MDGAGGCGCGCKPVAMHAFCCARTWGPEPPGRGRVLAGSAAALATHVLQVCSACDVVGSSPAC
eukprot:2145128-Prymnesium_polylepis.1